MGRRSKRRGRRHLRRWLTGQRKRGGKVVRGLTKRRTNAALHRQLAGYAILGVRLGTLTSSVRHRAWVAIAGATIHCFRARFPEAAIIGLDVEGAEHDVLERLAHMGDGATVVGEYHSGIHGRRFEELGSVFDGFDLDVPSNRTGVRYFRAVHR